MAGARLLLIRHGATALSEARRYCGRSDPPLSPEGRAQAVALGPRLGAERFAAVVASDRTRALETARLALPGRPVAPDPDWREMDFGRWEGWTHDEVVARDPEGAARFMAARFETPARGGESAADVCRRVRRAADRVVAAHPGGTVAVFTHGGPAALLRALAAGADPTGFDAFALAVADVASVAWPPAGPA